MEDQRLAEKMYRRTRDAPMSCRNSIDLLFVMQRHAVFTLNQDSADHISNIIFAQQFLEDAEPGKKYELIDDYSHRRYGAQPASKLREAMEQAGVKWAEILRDEDLVDVRIIVFPSEERDFEHVYPPVDLLEHPYGNQLQRFQGVKTILQEHYGAMPYRLKPRFKERVNMEVDLVITRAALERWATPYRQMVLNFKIHTITAPAPHSSLEVQQPTDTHLPVKHGEFAQLSMETLVGILRKRSSTIQRAVREAPKVSWNHPFPGGPQPKWSPDERPFLKEVESNFEWFENDFAARTIQIQEWNDARKAREEELHTRDPNPNFVLMEGLGGCKTYPPDSNLACFEVDLSAVTRAEYMKALQEAEQAQVQFDQELAMWKGLNEEDPPDPYAIEFYRRRAVKQELVLKAARKEFATISQGLPPPTRPKMTVRVPPMPPLQEVEEQSQVERSSRETQAETDPATSPPAAASDSPLFIFQLDLAEPEPGHIPIPQMTEEAKARAARLGPSARPSRRNPRNGKKHSAQAADRQKVQGGQNKQQPTTTTTTTSRNPRPAGSSRHPEHYPLSRLNMPQPTAVGSSRNPEQHPLSRLNVPQPAVAPRKDETRPEIKPRKVSFQLPGEDPPSAKKEPASQGQVEKPQSSSNKENVTPPLPKPASRLIATQLGGRSISEPNLASLSHAAGLGHYTAAAYKSTPCSLTVSPQPPKEIKVRGPALRTDQNDAMQSLRDTVVKDDLINLGTPQGVLPTLRRIMSGMIGGIA